MAAAVGSTAGGLAVFPGSGVAVAEMPSQCVQSQKAVTCAYTDNTGEVSPSGGVHGVPLRIPDGVWKVHIEAVGGRGGDSCCRTVAPGGRGAVARGDAWLVPGSTVYVRVGENGHGGGQPVFGSDGSSPASLAGGPGYGGSAGSSGATLPGPSATGSAPGAEVGPDGYGGGGGAAGGRIGGTGEANEPPGGGGGGLSLVPSGGTIGLSSPDSVPSVVVTFELP
jgi:hypothetical protein